MIYGLIWSLLAWFKKFSQIMLDFDFRGLVDHLVFMKYTSKGLVVVAVYVDDVPISRSNMIRTE